MAVLSVTFDSVSKEMKVTMDGNEISDVESVSFYKYSDSASMDLCSRSKKEGGVVSYTRLSASQKNEGSTFLDEQKTLAIEKVVASGYITSESSKNIHNESSYFKKLLDK